MNLGDVLDRIRPGPFSDAEWGRRLALVDGLIADSDVDALVVHGHLNARGALAYVSGFPARRDSYFVTAPGTDPTLYVQFYNHVPNATEIARVEDVRWGGVSSPETVAADLTDRVGSLRRVGIVGPVPYQHWQAIEGELTDVSLIDLSSEFTRRRLIKSDEELAWTRWGAALCDLALEAMIDACLPGATERSMGDALERVVRREGGQPMIHFIVGTEMTGSGRYVPAQNWSDRPLSHGDLVVTELSVGFGGYTGQVLRTITLGEPTDEVVQLHDVATEAFAAITGAIRPGVHVSELLEAAAVIDQRGYTICDDVIHGYGGGYLPPVLRTPETQRAAVPDFRLKPGMLLVVQPNVVTSDLRLGVQTGELVEVTEEGWRSMHNFPPGLTVLA